MNTDDFEQRLQRQPLRQIPAEWRKEILREGRRAAVHEIGDADTVSFPTLNWRTALTKIFWPHPKAWAGLAAVWVLILAVNFSMRDTSPVLAKSAPLSPEVIVELKQQRRMLAELIGWRDTSDADRSKSFEPRPRSERMKILAA